MPEIIISGIPVHFPYEPYKVQRDYMEKVIICLRDGTNGVLESPTGTGKTLSLLCSSLAWLLSRKQEIEVQTQTAASSTVKSKLSGLSLENSDIMNHMGGKSNWGLPKIIYASRTHSQLTQAMHELKRTAYSFMRSVVLGSRDQLCIHPEVMREQNNANKVQMCKLRIQSHQCTFYSRVESRKDDPHFRGPTIMDIEDLVKVGQQLRMCPYYASKELVGDADITFMPYNYLLDPIARKANKVELANTIVILDEAHNIEKICEEAASVQIKSSDVAMCIENVTHIMKCVTSSSTDDTQTSGDEPRDFTIDDLVLLKEMLLELEKVIDDIIVENKFEGATFPAAYIFDILGKSNINYGSSKAVIALLDKLVQYLAIESQNSIIRKGGCFQKLQEFLIIVFANKEDTIHKVYKSFKVHVQIEDSPQSASSKDGWLSKSTNKTAAQSKAAKVINYWCFNPGFGMEQLLNTNVRSIILTSGTLAPLNPLIAELSLPVAQRLENPHIVSASQVYVKIIGTGPDREQLISNFQNRDNPKYINSLGSTVLNVARIVPDGLLVFFPSYPLLNQCANCWQACGLWADIARFKPIFVEPRGKEDFNNIMEKFYQSIKNSKGACFLAVCRGKVSEGLDFADRNGRAVIITGLPYPPLKDPKVILKKKYLEDNRTKENELLSGQEWYSLDATRAVNQAIGRVIRHRDDYGAILLCDVRFQYNSQVQQLSKWIRDILGNQPKSSPFGPIVKELRDFFRNAEKTMVKPKERCIDNLSNELSNTISSKIIHKKAEEHKLYNFSSNSGKIENTNTVESWSPCDYAKATGLPFSSQLPNAMDFMSRLNGNVSAIDFNCVESSSGVHGNKDSSSTQLVKIHKRERRIMESTAPTIPSGSVKKRKYKIVESNTMNSSTLSPNATQSEHSKNVDSEATNESAFARRIEATHEDKQAPEERMEFLKILRAALNPTDFSAFSTALLSYKNDNNINNLMDLLFKILGKPDLLYMLRGMRRFLKTNHRLLFDKRLAEVSSHTSINPS